MNANDTRNRVLDAAERLFAENGVAATSLRTITAEADANLASVNYHFGSKDALLAEVFRRRAEPINRERLERLDRCLETDPADVEGILTAFLAPALKLGADAPPWTERMMRLVGRVHAEPDPGLQKIFLSIFAEVKVRFVEALAGALPELDSQEVTLRFHLLVGSMAHLMQHRHLLCAHEPGFSDVSSETFLGSIVTFLAAGCRAEPVWNAREASR